jgi:hypothetical protein
MKRSRLTILVAILLFGIGQCMLQARRSDAMNQNSNKESKPITWVLSGIGRDYDCFFTIEDGWNEADSEKRLEAGWSERRLENGGLIQELEQLRRSVPNFSYEFNTVNSRIVHIIDVRLKQQKEYALEDTIKSLDFKGKVNELPDEIGKQGVPIALPTWQSTHEQRDGSTIVYVKGEGLSVRGALSNFIKLDGRDRILWVARTKLEPGATSYVFYPWPGPMGK